MSLVKEALVRLLRKQAAPIAGPTQESLWHLGDAAKSIGHAGVAGGKALYGLGKLGWGNPYSRAAMQVGGILGAKKLHEKYKEWEAKQPRAHPLSSEQYARHLEGHYG